MAIKEYVGQEIRGKRGRRSELQGSENGAGNKNIVGTDRKERSRLFLFLLIKETRTESEGARGPLQREKRTRRNQLGSWDT